MGKVKENRHMTLQEKLDFAKEKLKSDKSAVRVQTSQDGKSMYVPKSDKMMYEWAING